MNTFWKKIEEGLANEFSLRTLTPTLAFWSVGVFIWGFKNDGGWEEITDILNGLRTTQAILFALALLFLLQFTNWIADFLKSPLLRFMEGYWAWPLAWLREKRIIKIKNDLVEKRIQLAKLAALEEMTGDQEREYAILEAKSNRHPEENEFILPTQVGNLIRASEQYSNRIYGLEIVTIFPRLWLVLSEGVQGEIAETRLHLDNQVKIVLFGTALLGWSFLSLWTIPLAVVIVIWGYQRTLNASEVYGLMIKAAFDLYRFDLFTKLHFKLPKKASEEIIFGIKVTQALSRGFKDITFEHSK
jgi:hypothetical protein